MSDKSVNISSKSIFWVLSFATIMILLIIALNMIDTRKKYNQYKAIFDKIQDSEYPERLGSLIQDFSVNDTALIKLTNQSLGLLKEDFSEVDYSEIYIHGPGCYYSITDNQFLCSSELVSEISFLPKNIEKYTNYLDASPNPDVDSLYSFLSDDSELELMIKISNGYLRVIHYRN